MHKILFIWFLASIPLSNSKAGTKHMIAKFYWKEK